MSILKITLIGLSLSSSLLNAEFLSVQVKKTVLRDKPSFLGKSIAKLSYADQVESAATQNDWSKVKTIKGESIGWVHSSALINKTIILSSRGKLTNSSVSQSEVLMAGKGFNKEVESAYKKKNAKLDFTLVNKIERANAVSAKRLISFAKDGKLSI